MCPLTSSCWIWITSDRNEIWAWDFTALVEVVKSLSLSNIKENSKVPYQKPQLKSVAHGVYPRIAQCVVPTQCEWKISKWTPWDMTTYSCDLGKRVPRARMPDSLTLVVKLGKQAKRVPRYARTRNSHDSCDQNDELRLGRLALVLSSRPH